MLFELNEEQLMIQKAARDFAKTECLPGVIERDEKQQFHGRRSRTFHRYLQDRDRIARQQGRPQHLRK